MNIIKLDAKWASKVVDVQSRIAEEAVMRGLEYLRRGERFQAVKEFVVASSAFAMIGRNCQEAEKERNMQLSKGYSEAGAILAKDMSVDPAAVESILGPDRIWKLGELLRNEDKRW